MKGGDSLGGGNILDHDGGVGLYWCIQLSKPSKCILKVCDQHVLHFKRKRAEECALPPPPIVVQWKQIRLGTMRLQLPSLASLSGLRIWRCCGCGEGRQL